MRSAVDEWAARESGASPEASGSRARRFCDVLKTELRLREAWESSEVEKES